MIIFLLGIQGEWSSWSTCNTTCGYGTMNRTRSYCITKNGASCSGNTSCDCINFKLIK